MAEPATNQSEYIASLQSELQIKNERLGLLAAELQAARERITWLEKLSQSRAGVITLKDQQLLDARYEALQEREQRHKDYEQLQAAQADIAEAMKFLCAEPGDSIVDAAKETDIQCKGAIAALDEAKAVIEFCLDCRTMELGKLDAKWQNKYNTKADDPVAEVATAFLAAQGGER
jgi:DNA repair exonuclease SbcCD ATPase subunit